MERIHVFTSSNANSGFSNPPASVAPKEVEPDMKLPVFFTCILIVLAIAGCATPKKDSLSVKPKPEAAAKKTPIHWLSWLKFPKKTPPPPLATPIDWTGVIRLVNEDERFVLIQAQGGRGVIAGEKYLCIRDAAETGVLRMTALRNPPFLIADILSGDPLAGDKVYLPSPTVVAPSQPPPP
ncbi:MAG: hypothetical protein NTZ94_11685 [Verrucomicrobia bacterium]|nr:hypothetical protein [Verrucomicrobiota bacterium]